MGLVAKLRTLLTAGQGALRGIEADRLTEQEAGVDPFPLFDRWFTDAQRAGIYLHDAMTLATVSTDGDPAARQVLLKQYGPDQGFVFYTNYESRKARELDASSRAALLLHWATLHRQIRIEGRAERTSKEVSETYHARRPRGSQIAAWASQQSAEIPDREALEREFREREEEFAGRDVPLPPFWGGYRLVPDRIEFWQGRANRMHDRLLYRAVAGGWEVIRLSP
jgi:pyridoxamine 5'-phosphate oxidase